MLAVVALLFHATLLVQPALAATGPAKPNAQTEKEAPRRTPDEILNAARASIEETSKLLEQDNLEDNALVKLRQQLVATTGQIQALISDLSPRVTAISAQLAQLGPRPAEGEPPESETTAKEREDRAGTLARLQANVSLAETLMVQANQMISSINDQRRAAFAQQLLDRSYSLFSPALWTEAIEGIPDDIKAARAIFAEMAAKMAQHRDKIIAPAVLTLVIGFGLYFLRKKFMPSRRWRRKGEKDPPRLYRVMKAIGLLIGRSLPTSAAFFAFYISMDDAGLAEGRFERVIILILLAIAFITFMRAMAEAIFAPNLPTWRMVNISDETAAWMVKSVDVFCVVMLLSTIAQEFTGAVAQGLSSVALVDGICSVAIAIVLVWSMHGLRKRTIHHSEDFGPYVSTGPDAWNLVKFMGWLAAFIIMAAVVTGYVALASFIIDQIIWVALLIGLFFLISTLIEEILVEVPRRNARVSLVLQTSVGLRSQTLEQIGILISGALKLFLFLLVILMALSQWGIESNDVFVSFRRLQQGFSIGEVRIAPMDFISAIVSLGLTLIAARIIQRWLANRFLPATGLDIGIRNSISTGVGYLGFFAAFAVAVGQVGLGLERIAIVAGALSVGIGFGLQSVVNNFVSGLILLWERPIKVGDWVVVGQEQGYVKRINVRATEIETFDRAAVIVPNSNLVSGVVKNWLHHDKTGRITVSVGVTYAADPDEIRELLLACAREHKAVLEAPSPIVLLRAFEPTMLRFELRCFISDVESIFSVTSDLNFAVLRVLRARDFVPVRPMVWEEWQHGRPRPDMQEEGGYQQSITSREQPIS